MAGAVFFLARFFFQEYAEAKRVAGQLSDALLARAGVEPVHVKVERTVTLPDPQGLPPVNPIADTLRQDEIRELVEERIGEAASRALSAEDVRARWPLFWEEAERQWQREHAGLRAH